MKTLFNPSFQVKKGENIFNTRDAIFPFALTMKVFVLNNKGGKILNGWLSTSGILT